MPTTKGEVVSSTSNVIVLGRDEGCYTNTHSIHSGLLRRPEFLFFHANKDIKEVYALSLLQWYFHAN